jgi:RNase P subunit RPR2
MNWKSALCKKCSYDIIYSQNLSVSYDKNEIEILSLSFVWKCPKCGNINSTINTNFIPRITENNNHKEGGN